MNTCKNCQHWTQPKTTAGDYIRPLGWRECWAPSISQGYSQCRDMPSSGAMVECDEGWGMMTGPDFGCVHFVPRAT